jgi:hypothetical protein
VKIANLSAKLTGMEPSRAPLIVAMVLLLLPVHHAVYFWGVGAKLGDWNGSGIVGADVTAIVSS